MKKIFTMNTMSQNLMTPLTALVYSDVTLGVEMCTRIFFMIRGDSMISRATTKLIMIPITKSYLNILKSTHFNPLFFAFD